MVELSYAGPGGRLRFELVQEALMPVAGQPGGGRFTQAMRTHDELVLLGERIEIDGYFTRERRWSAVRPEDDGPTAPNGVEVRLLDAGGETYEIAGETRARAPLNVWPNVLNQQCLMRYRLNGRHCHGDFQDLQSNSFLRSTRRPGH